jgi:hypothetical protein
MRRILEIAYQGKESSFTVRKLKRSKLYGSKHRIPVDVHGRECSRASLTRDGLYILPTGGTAMLYLDEHNDVVEREHLHVIDTDGEIMKQGDSVLNEVLEIGQVVQAADILECTITHVYALEPIFLSQELNSLLSEGAILRMPLPDLANQNHRQSFLLGNDNGYFLVIGDATGFEFIGLAEADLSPPDFVEDGYDTDDDIDFGMFML